MRFTRSARLLLAVLPVALLAAAAWALHRELATFHFRDVARTVSELRATHLAIAVGLTALNYFCLTLYDVVALRYLDKRIAYPEVGLTSFVAYAFGHNLGFAALSGGSIRLRMYSERGLTAFDVAKMAAFNGATFWLGYLATAGYALMWTGAFPGLGASPVAVRAFALVAWALLVVYLAACWRVRGELAIRQFRFAFPTLRVALLQVGISILDWLLAAAVLQVLLPASGPTFVELIVLFLAAQVAGLASQVPGGLGVFESVVVAALSPEVPAPTVLGILVVYRIIYYLLPFATAALALAGTEVFRRRTQLTSLARRAHRSLAPMVPAMAAVAAFVGGSVLLVSGATPTVPVRLEWLRAIFPLAFVEASHFFGSLFGVALLLVARGLQQRIDAAWLLMEVLLLGGALLSVTKGLDYEEAALLCTFSIALLPFRRQFFRRGSLLNERLTAEWVLAIALVIGASVYLGFFSYRHVEYDHELWWQFTFQGDAPRFLRASVGAVAAALIFGARKLMSPPPHAIAAPTPEDLAAARVIVDRSPDSAAHLALLGDKALLFNAQRTAFIMYAVSGRAWVAMGDPVGPPAEATELAWEFRALAERHRGWTCFYEVSPEHLPRYLDLGLALLKVGEEALVPLQDFSLEGPERRSLRQAVHRMEREGLSFELLAAEAVPVRLAELRAISDRWLAEKSTREKGFSLGFFDEAYLSSGPVALALRGGRPVAFANVWTSAARVELSVDLMRSTPDAPNGVMEFLFASLMTWGAAQGYQRFSLGVAPFSGFEARQYAPLWNRLGAFLFRHGEHFYNFQGLRQFKEKFSPQWRPRYLAAPSGLTLTIVLGDIAALVSRGLSGVVRK